MTLDLVYSSGAYQVCSNDGPRLTLTYLTSRSNLLSNAFKWDFFLKDDFLNTVEAKVIITARYVQSNETMTINKFQRWRYCQEVPGGLDIFSKDSISFF